MDARVYLFWDGPDHGKARMVPGHFCRVMVGPPVPLSLPESRVAKLPWLKRMVAKLLKLDREIDRVEIPLPQTVEYRALRFAIDQHQIIHLMTVDGVEPTLDRADVLYILRKWPEVVDRRPYQPWGA